MKLNEYAICLVESENAKSPQRVEDIAAGIRIGLMAAKEIAIDLYDCDDYGVGIVTFCKLENTIDAILAGDRDLPEMKGERGNENNKL